MMNRHRPLLKQRLRKGRRLPLSLYCQLIVVRTRLAKLAYIYNHNYVRANRRSPRVGFEGFCVR